MPHCRRAERRPRFATGVRPSWLLTRFWAGVRRTAGDGVIASTYAGEPDSSTPTNRSRPQARPMSRRDRRDRATPHYVQMQNALRLPFGAFGWIDHFRGPDSSVDVVEVDQPIVRLRSPGERNVRPESFRVSRPQASHLASLPVEISAQFSRHIDDARAAAVVADVHHVVLDPHVVGALF